MTTTYDPAHPAYRQEADFRDELERVFDLCHGCRLCFNLCPSFPTLFDAIDEHDGVVGDVTVAEQNQVVDECYQCKLCYVKCPYVPPHEWALDFPRLMMRAQALRHEEPRPFAERAADQMLARTDLVGTVSSAAAPFVNALTGTPGSPVRKLMEKATGIASERLLPPYARERFTTWFRKRNAPALEAPRAEVTVFPTCFVEYMEPEIAKDLVAVCERNEIACSLPAGTRCCGAPWLHAGDVEHFQDVARRNVAALATDVRAGKDVIVAQPTCAYVIKQDYKVYAPGPDADLVAAHTFDAAEYLVNEHRRAEGGLDVAFEGEVPEQVVYHLACHLRAQNIGYRGRDLMALTGARVTLVERCSGIDGTWGYRAENYGLAKKVARPLVRELTQALEANPQSQVCGDCHLANTAILEETGARPLHPVQVLARAYGISETTR
jgi:glycerol-3-phosphate dehydrogenase subunit C